MNVTGDFMQALSQKTELTSQFGMELQKNILPFWMIFTPDRENGGFFGAISNDKVIHNQVERSAVLCARILWTFSTAAKIYRDPSYLQSADRAFEYLTTRFWDSQYEGIFWSVDQHGRPVQDRKHTYAQAFSIYGLSAYYQATGNINSLDYAKKLFALVERNTFDPINGGNLECRARDWTELQDMRLSKIDLNSQKSMNTLLHLMEAYAALATVWPDKILLSKLEGLLHLFLNRIIDPVSGHQRLFFDNRWNSLSENISYGHDIETGWLFLEAAEILGNPELISQARAISERMAQAVYDESLREDGSILYESGPHGHKVLERHWWAHAEAVVGFYNAYQVSGKEYYADASVSVWHYIQDHFVDHQNGDWFKLLDEDGRPILTQNKVGPWECPYHHARMCFEMIRRLND